VGTKGIGCGVEWMKLAYDGV